MRRQVFVEHLGLCLRQEARGGEDLLRTDEVHGNKGGVVDPSEESHLELAIHAISDAPVPREDGVEVFDGVGPLDGTREKRRSRVAESTFNETWRN